MEDTFFIFVGILIGLILGSFTTALIYRHMNGQSVLFNLIDNKKIAARSQCPKCGHKLQAFDLIPVLSWLLLRGKCRYCKSVIPVDYPLIEIVVTFFTAFIVFHYQVSIITLGLLLILPISITLLVAAWKNDSHSQSRLIKIFFLISFITWLGMVYVSEDPLHLFKILTFSAIAGGVAILIYAWSMTLLFSKGLSRPTLVCFTVYAIWVGWSNLPVFVTVTMLLVLLCHYVSGFTSSSRFNGFFSISFLIYILLQPYDLL
ncbi:MAG: hypothetical protein CL565_01945 [Alphaproteobacteria bacterium]|nr:hypothetical protein [Alphaproteobacteria bacterium]|tara:strand:+ start:4352 stop:5131 length:780 start_codon:yes stop_codon:yes gene_type:complete